MFKIFKKIKPKLSELIPKNFVDIHSHVLPGIDDGAKNVEDSLFMLREMNNMGFKKVYGTPHTYPGLYDNSSMSIKKSFKSIANKKIKIKISYASEYFLDDSLIKKSEENNLLSLKNNLVLVEMGFLYAPINLHDIVFNLQLNGYQPILAHPERYSFLFNDIKSFENLKNIGLKFQLNLLSVVNYYGRTVSEISDKLLKNNLIDFVGSDAHTIHHLRAFEKNINIENVEKLNKAIEANNYFYD